MTSTILTGARLAGVTSVVPDTEFDNVRDTQQFDQTEVKKVVALAGVKARRITTGSLCTSDLCLAAAQDLLAGLDWAPESVDALILVTQSPDYFLPSTSSLMHRDLALGRHCAVFDVGLGCSGYPYGLWLANMMVQTGSAKRVLLLHGDTPSLFTDKNDRSTYLLFGDGGTATAVEKSTTASEWGFCLHSDGTGCNDLIIPGGGFRNRKPDNERDCLLYMNGPNLFNFTVARVPELIDETLQLMNSDAEQTDLFFFHQSNQFIMKHIAKKCGLSAEKTPIILDKFGNIGGASIPLAMTQYLAQQSITSPQKAMLLGYGVGLSWGSAFIDLDSNIFSSHRELAEKF
ncbi:MAG TPA: ketoacyl-ACP synthase III [Cellvibrio sp.]|nr:ketoacyl-ACP synthase III [Cellvibrio sp.]